MALAAWQKFQDFQVVTMKSGASYVRRAPKVSGLAHSIARGCLIAGILLDVFVSVDEYGGTWDTDPTRTAESVAVSAVTHVAAEVAYAWAGGIIGAAIGTAIFPGVGTAIGAVAGAAAGAALGGWVADQLDKVTIPKIWGW